MTRGTAFAFPMASLAWTCIPHGPHAGTHWASSALSCPSPTLHYVTSLHSVLLHEVFQRLYYLPVVAAGVLFGWRAALATSALASVLFVPHIVMAWHAWPVLQVDQYGEVLLFNLVGLVTGVLADRVRQERNRYREVAVRLENAHAEIVARMDERFSMDRLVTVGRLASGIAHEIRNPLGSLLGCLEILAPDCSQRGRRARGVPVPGVRRNRPTGVHRQ